MSDLQASNASTGSGSYGPATNRPQTIMGETQAPRDPYYNKMKPIEIRQADLGFIVTVGCQTLAIQTKNELISKFIEYVNAPAETEAKHLEGKLF
jgi:hypothetical protein